MDKQRLHDIQRSFGVDTVDLIEYKLPRPHEDILDNASNFMQYAHAKAVLESVGVNHILKSMGAFDALNGYDVQTYVDLAESVTAGYDNFLKSQEGEDYPEMNEVATEIFVEYTADAYAQDNGMAAGNGSPPDAMGGMDMMGKENLPDKPISWFEKLARKLGFKDIDFKDMLYLYLINKYNHSGDDEGEGGMAPMQSMVSNMQQSGGMRESHELALKAIVENTPPELEGWSRSVERKFMNLHPQDWQEKLYSTVCEHYINSVKPIDEASDASLDASEDAGEDEQATTTVNNDNANDAVAGPKLTATVKADVKKRLSELNKLITDYDNRKHWYGEKKPAIFNARDSLEFIMDKCKSGTMDDYKLAQIHLQKLMSPITDLYPPSLIKFLAHGSDGTENKLMKPVE